MLPPLVAGTDVVVVPSVPPPQPAPFRGYSPWVDEASSLELPEPVPEAWPPPDEGSPPTPEPVPEPYPPPDEGTPPSAPEPTQE